MRIKEKTEKYFNYILEKLWKRKTKGVMFSARCGDTNYYSCIDSDN